MISTLVDQLRLLMTDPAQMHDLSALDVLSLSSGGLPSTLAAERYGVLPFVGEQGVASGNIGFAWATHRLIKERISRSDVPYLVLDPRPGLHILDANKSYAAITMTHRSHLRGLKLFEAFPANPKDMSTSGVDNLYRSLCEATRRRATHGMMTQRYDVVDSNGVFVERHWSPANTPFFDDCGRLVYLLHHVRDVTEEVLKATSSNTRTK